MRCEEAQELITGLVDNELSTEERSAIENHLADCLVCRGQWERETALKKSLRRASAAVAAPADLRAKIHGLGQEPAAERRWAKPGIGGWFGWPRPVWAFAIIVLAAAALFYPWHRQADIGAEALATHERVVAGQEVVTRHNNPAELRKQLALAVNNRFAPVALDFSMAKLYPVAGFVKKIAGREVLVTVYEGDGPTITCYTFLGTEADAPNDAEPLRDEELRVDFFVFARDDMSAVMHRVGEVICILAANLPAAELIDLLRAKAHHA